MPDPTLNLQSIELESTLRPTGLNGAPVSGDYNDSMKEILLDLATISQTFNADILPLVNSLLATAALPANAAIGIQGSTIFSDTTDQTSLFYDVLNSQPLTLSESLRIQQGQIANINTLVNNLGVQVQSLSTSLSTTGQNDVASAISGMYSLIATIEAQIISLQAGSGNATTMLKNIQSQTVATAIIFPDAIDSINIVWGSPFPDNTYSVSYGLNDDTGMLTILNYSYLAGGTGITIRVKNHDPVNNISGIISVTARMVG